MQANITLFQLNSMIREVLDEQLETSYWVIAEIGEIRLNQKGHCYLELVEKEGDLVVAKIKANIWAYTYRNICGWFESITGKTLQPGMKILTQVSVSFHEIYGLSLNIKDIDPNFTLGERAQRRLQVINQLKEDGIFDMNKELELPLVPQKIAVISAPNAAGFEDFMAHLRNNPYRYQFEITLFKALMQGSEAKSSIINAMLEINNEQEKFDIMVIIRGGGAQVDLDCFDTYDLACHVAQFPLPVLTGIGHERDETIVDMVAHTKMKTPTAVAEFIIGGLRSFEEKLDFLFNRMVDHGESTIKDQVYALNGVIQKLRFTAKSILSENKYRLNKLEININNNIKSKLYHHGSVISLYQERLIYGFKDLIKEKQQQLINVEKQLNLINPENVLKRGYSITKINDINIQKTLQINEGDEVTTITSDKIIKSRVETSEKKFKG